MAFSYHFDFSHNNPLSSFTAKWYNVAAVLLLLFHTGKTMKSSLRLLFGCLITFSVGCQPAAQEAASDGAKAEVDSHAGHDHGAHDVGPHGGHLLHLEPNGAHAEWTHDDKSSLITVYLDDFDAAKISSAKFIAKVGEESHEFPLASEGDGWSISSAELMTHINMKEAAEVSFEVVDDAGTYSSKIEAHDEHHH